MYGTANAPLAAAVSKASGFGMSSSPSFQCQNAQQNVGFIGGGLDFTPNNTTISTLSTELSKARTTLGFTDPQSTLPLGIGFLNFHPSRLNLPSAVEPLLLEHRPAAVWLSFPTSPQDQSQIIPAVKKIGEPWGLRIFVPVGSVQAAREAATDGADVIVAQGIDSGGHQWAQGAGVLSLVPEVRDVLDAEFPDGTIPVLAAGGIVDGRGVAAALALGADGVVMGTRFVATEEASTPQTTKDTIVAATDGGFTTIKSTVHDDIQGTGFWPAKYDGRAVIGRSYEDHAAGLSMEDNVKQFKAAREAGDPSRTIVWAGTGVGLVKKVLSAGEVVEQTRNQAKEVLQKQGRL